MEDGTKTFGLERQAMARLLKIGMGESAGDNRTPDQVKADMGGAILAGPVPEGAASAQVVTVLGGAELPCGQKSLRDTLIQPTPSLEVLGRIKDFGKALSGVSADPNQHAVGAAVYNAAIAAAAVHHGQKITLHPWKSMAVSFGQLAEKPWMPADLAALFAQARQLCAGRTDG